MFVLGNLIGAVATVLDVLLNALGIVLIVNALLSWVLVEASLASFDKIPFTCSYLPGKANLPYSAGLYFAIFATYSTAMSQIGYRALTGPRWQPLIWLVVVLTALAIGFRWHRRQRPESSDPIVFDDEPEGLVTLRLLQ